MVELDRKEKNKLYYDPMPKSPLQSIPRFLLSFLILAAFLLLSAPAVLWLIQQATPPAERLRKEGDQFLAEGRVVEAVLSYRQAVEADDQNLKALAALADGYHRQQRYRTAARYQEKANQISGVQRDIDSQTPAPGSPAHPLLWMVEPAESVPVGGAIDGDTLIAAYEDGTVAAVNLLDGQVRWRITAGTPITSLPGLDATYAWVGTGEGEVIAFDHMNGQERWRFRTGGPVYAAPESLEGILYCASSDGILYALKTETGELLWNFKTGGQLHTAPLATATGIFVGSTDGKLYALDPLSGTPLWPDGILTNGPVEGRPGLNGDRLVFGSGDSRVYALSAASGGLYWRVSVRDSVFAAPLFLPDRIIIASSGATLSALDNISGKILWKVGLVSALRSTPALDRGQLFAAADTGENITVVDAANGSLIEQIPTGDWIAAGPWVVDQAIVLLGKDGAVLALSR